MIVGLGTDVVKIQRMERLLERHPERAGQRLFTDGERAYCAGRAWPAECFAARFAAKEALLKALGVGLSAGIPWREIEVLSNRSGNPRLEVFGRALSLLEASGAERIHLSFSHDAGVAVAVVVLEGGPAG